MAYLVPDQLRTLVAPPLSPKPMRPKGGRRRALDLVAHIGIVFVLRTGMKWHELPSQLVCSGEICWRRLRDWREAEAQRHKRHQH